MSRNMAETALELGYSEFILIKHYRNVVTMQPEEEYFYNHAPYS